MKTYKITEKDYILANRKARREEEISLYGKQISMMPTKTFKSKKVYDRHEKHKKSFAV